MKHYIYIKTKVKNKFKMLVKLYKYNINIYDIYEYNDYCFLKILKSDFEVLKNDIVTIEFTYVKDSGLFHLKNLISPLKILIIVLFLFLINLFSKFIISVDIIHSNKDIINLVSNELENNGIKRFSLRKEYEEIGKIKETILNNNKNNLEWIEIEKVGMKYIIRIEQRIIKNQENNNKNCHIIASKDGIISSIVSSKGEVLVHNGSFVKKGDILISGEIKYNESIKNNVCASGKVLAEVWYKTNVTMPLSYEIKNKTGKKRVNFGFEIDGIKHKIFKSRLKDFESIDKKIFSFLNFSLYKIQEEEISVTKNLYNEEEAIDKALNLADDKIGAKFSDNDYINFRKVLKKSINDSKIDIEVFYSVIEDISNIIEYTPENIVEEGS